MRSLLTSILVLAAGAVPAGFETWVRQDGRRAVMNLVGVEQENGRQIVRFKLRNGRSHEMPVSDLSAASQRRLETLAEFKQPQGTTAPLYRISGKDPSFRQLIESGKLRPVRSIQHAEQFWKKKQESWRNSLSQRKCAFSIARSSEPVNLADVADSIQVLTSKKRTNAPRHNSKQQ